MITDHNTVIVGKMYDNDAHTSSKSQQWHQEKGLGRSVKRTALCEDCCELVAHNCTYPSTPHILHPLSLPTSSIQYIQPSSLIHFLLRLGHLIPQLVLSGLQHPHLILQLPLSPLVPLQLLQLVPLHCPSAGPTSSGGEVARMEGKGTVQNQIQQWSKIKLIQSMWGWWGITVGSIHAIFLPHFPLGHTCTCHKQNSSYQAICENNQSTCTSHDAPVDTNHHTHTHIL